MGTPNSGTREFWGTCSPPLGCGRGVPGTPGGPRSTVRTALTICVPPSPRTLSRGLFLCGSWTRSPARSDGPSARRVPHDYPWRRPLQTALAAGVSEHTAAWAAGITPCILIFSFSPPRRQASSTSKIGAGPGGPRITYYVSDYRSILVRDFPFPFNTWDHHLNDTRKEPFTPEMCQEAGFTEITTDVK